MNHDPNHEHDSQPPVPDAQDSPADEPVAAPDPQPEARPQSAARDVDPNGAAGAWKVGRMLLAPLVAISAVCTHFVLNVPSEATINDNKRQAEDDRKRQEAERRGQQGTPAAAPYKLRDAVELARVEKQYRGTPFAKEPIIAEWSRKAQTYINRAISIARKKAFEGMEERPTVSIRELRCRTVRCRFIVKAKDQATADQFVKTFKGTRAQGRPVWRNFETKRIAGGGDQPTEIRVTTALLEDQPDPKLLDGAEVAKAEAPTDGEAPKPDAAAAEAVPTKTSRTPKAPTVDLAAQGRSPAAKPRRMAPPVAAGEGEAKSKQPAAAAPG